MRRHSTVETADTTADTRRRARPRLSLLVLTLAAVGLGGCPGESAMRPDVAISAPSSDALLRGFAMAFSKGFDHGEAEKMTSAVAAMKPDDWSQFHFKDCVFRGRVISEFALFLAMNARGELEVSAQAFPDLVAQRLLSDELKRLALTPSRGG